MPSGKDVMAGVLCLTRLKVSAMPGGWFVAETVCRTGSSATSRRPIDKPVLLARLLSRYVRRAIRREKQTSLAIPPIDEDREVASNCHS